MGIDACGCFYTKEPLGDFDLNELNNRFARCGFQFPVDKDFFRRGGTSKRLEINYDLARFWGPGYERAGFESVIAVLGWLRRQPEVAEVFYWGDCSDEEDATQFDEKREAEYVEHYFRFGYPYRSRR
jgi:hypothetical protein